MLKLGALLLKGFSKPKRRVYERPQSSRSLQPSKKKAHAKKISKSETALANPIQVTPRKKLPIVLPETVSGNTQSFKDTDLIRPNDQLKKSIEAFLLDQRSEHTRRAYGKDLKRFVQYLISRKLERGASNIDRGVVIGYKDFLLSEKLEHTTIDRHLATLRSFFRWMVEDEVLAKNPAENVRFLNPKRESKTQGFSDDEVRKVLLLPNLHTKTGTMHYAILMVLFYCGLRRSELCSIRTSQMGFERGHHFLRLQGKGNAERIVVMLPQVWNAIQFYLKITRKDARVDQPLFTPIRNNRTGNPNKFLDPSMIFYIVTKYAKQAGIENRVSPHSCRATALSNARDHNVPDRAIQEFAGWSTTTMITRYDKRKTALEKSAVHSISYGEEERDLPDYGLNFQGAKADSGSK